MKRFMVVVSALVFVAALAASALSSTGSDGLKEGAGFKVLIKGEGGWAEAGSIPDGIGFERRTLDLAGRLPDADGEYKVRMSHADAGMVNLDSVSIEAGGSALKLLRAYDIGDRRNLYAKLGERDYDVINAQGRTVELVFDAPKGAKGKARLAVVGREENPNDIPGGPCAFPSALHPSAGGGEVFTYRLGQNPGAINVDGVITPDDGLGEPIFKSMTRPISGHPDGYTYGYLKNDDRYLYGTVDFTPDNTYDGTEDFAALVIRTPSGWKKFTVKVDKEDWGKPGFTYTNKVAYQHKVYEFRIPLERLGISAKRGDEVELKYVAYGTAACPTALNIAPVDVGQ
jgi:hypothetical protein